MRRRGGWLNTILHKPFVYAGAPFARIFLQLIAGATPATILPGKLTSKLPKLFCGTDWPGSHLDPSE
jgi:hypothetical protein